MSGSGISWTTCKSASHSRQITTPAPHHSVFLQAGCPSCCPTNSVKALKANLLVQECIGFCLFSQCISSSLSSSSISFKIFIMFLFLLTATVGSISTSGVEMSNVSQPSRNGEFINKQEAGSVEVVMFV